MVTARTKSGRLRYTIGLPRSGKSYFCEQWVIFQDKETLEVLATFNNKNPSYFKHFNPRVIVGGDEFRKSVHGRNYEPYAEGLVFATVDIATRALLLAGHDVIIDETSTSVETLKRWYRLDINARPVWIDTSVEVCRQRAIDAKKDYLLLPIERINKQVTLLKANFEQIIKDIKAELIARRSQDTSI